MAPKPRDTIYLYEIDQTQEKHNQVTKRRKYLLMGVQDILTSQSARGVFRSVVIKLCSMESWGGVNRMVFPGLFDWGGAKVMVV